MHLKKATALDLIEGRLPNEIAQQCLNHVAECSRCSSEVQQHQMFLESLKRPHLQSAPDSLLQSTTALYQPPAERIQRLSMRQVIALVIYDSFTQPAFAGARGEGG